MDKSLKEYLDINYRALQNGNKDFESIYTNMFRCEERVLCETFDGFRIKKMSYGEVKKSCDRVSAALYNRIGATHGFVALEMENSPDWIAAFWGILRSGNKPYLVNCRHPKIISDRIIEALGIKYIIGSGSTVLSGEFIDINELRQGSDGFTGEFENEIAISTSATSLNETICFYTGREISEQILCAKDILKKSPRMAAHYKGQLKQLAFLPFYHVFGLTAVYFWFTYFGRTLVFLRDYSPDTILKTCRRHEVTHIFAVPMLWHTVEKQLLKKVHEKGEKTEKKFKKGLKISAFIQKLLPGFGPAASQRIMREVTDELFGQSVKFCITGGSYIKSSALELINGIGYPLHNGYGMSEIGITSVELGKTLKARNRGSIGLPFSSTEYRIGERGTLLVKGNSRAVRLMKNGEVYSLPEWFDTGDIMEACEDGYYILGREGDLVIGENGENINPDITEQIFSLPDAVNYCVLGLKSQETERCTLIVQISPYLSHARIEKMIKSVYDANSSLPIAMGVKDFYFTYEPIMSETAIKVSRKGLTRLIENGGVKLIPFSEISAHSTGDGDFNSDSPLARRVREIVASELGRDISEIDDNAHIISDMGAESLQYFAIISRLAEEFSVTSYSDKENYRYTVREFCEYLEEHI